MSEEYTATESLAELTDGANVSIGVARERSLSAIHFGDWGEVAFGIGLLCDVADRLLILIGAAQTMADGLAARVAALEAANAR